LNPSGYFFYSIYTSTGFIDANLGSGQVDWQDLFFACHGLCLSTAQLVQCLVYSRGNKGNNEFKLWVVLFLAAEYIVFITFLILQITGHKMPNGATVINICGYCKAAITLLKYSPQVYLNYKNKSTSGWSIGNVMLDFSGGMFSLLQLVIEAIGNDRPIIQDGAFNLIKFMLSILSIGYNIIFFIQHYVLYPPHKRENQLLEESKSTSIVDGDEIIQRNT
jgi:cystinosin